ncbi:hypothetical protein [Sneathia sanguinegens]|uniref:hypothetical protein n=1 Tax=Sneathia sanguinegens TaxID=40543 RepID=UPI00288BDF7F|nr:hypothetical protein [Sneathia sanguinegens]
MEKNCEYSKAIIMNKKADPNFWDFEHGGMFIYSDIKDKIEIINEKIKNNLSCFENFLDDAKPMYLTLKDGQHGEFRIYLNSDTNCKRSNYKTDEEFKEAVIDEYVKNVKENFTMPYDDIDNLINKFEKELKKSFDEIEYELIKLGHERKLDLLNRNTLFKKQQKITDKDVQELENKLNLKNNEVKIEAKMEFKTYDEFKEDAKKEIINNLDIKEKLDIYNRYCENNLDYESILNKNDEDFLQNMFEGDFNALAQAITCGEYNSKDDYVKLDSDGDLKSYYFLTDALEDNFVGDELIDFALEYKDIYIDDLYDEYIHDTLELAQQTMSDEEYENLLKEYASNEMEEKYPELNDIANWILDEEVSDEKDIQKSKEIDDDWER